MKKLITLLTAAALIFTLTSCDELNDLLKVTFEDVEVEQTLDVPVVETRNASIVTDSDNMKQFSHSIAFFELDDVEANDSTQEENLADYLDDITKVTITDLQLTILNSYMGVILPDFTITDLVISITKDSTIIYTETIAAVTNGMPILARDLTDAVIASISEAVVDNESLTFKAEGYIMSEEPINNFNITIKTIADIEAGLGTTLTGADS